MAAPRRAAARGEVGRVVWMLAACVIAGVLQQTLIVGVVGVALAFRAWVMGTRAAWAWVLLTVFCGATGAGSMARGQRDRGHVSRAATAAHGAATTVTGWVASFPRSSPFGTAFLLDTNVDGRRVRLWTRAGCFDVDYGDVLTVTGRIEPLAGAADASLAARGAAGTVRARFSGVTRERGVRGDPLRRRVLWPIHRAARARLCRALGARAALPVALLLGERGYVDRATYDAVVRLGVVHLLAISGMHLAVIGAIAIAAAWFLPRRRHLLAVATLTLYIGIVGDVASLTRAYVMALMLAGARALARPLRPVDALGKTLLVVLLASPVALLSVGLQLSFAATFAVVSVVTRAQSLVRAPRPSESRGLRRAWSRLVRSVVAAIVLSACVEVFIVPLQLTHFGRASAAGPLATPVFFVPVAVVQVLAIAAAALAGVPVLGPASMAALGAASKATEAALLATARLVPPPVAHAAPHPGAYYGGLLVLWIARGRPAAWPVGVGLVVLSFALG